MKKLFLISYFLFLISYLSYSQINRVINPSFELDTCIESWTGTGEVFQYVQGWDTLRNGGGGTPDIFDECYVPSSPFESYDVPVNSASFQYPKSGIGYSALMAILNITGGDVREYIQGTLTQQLISGNSYCVKLYVNLSNFSKKSGNSFGIYFDDGQITADANNLVLPNVIPQIQNAGQQLDDTLNWIKIEGSFVAAGIEEYLTIGNFLPDDSSNVVESYPSSSYPGGYYNIDDVSVIDISTPAFAGNNTTITIGDSIFIGRQPEIGLNDDCIWYVNGNPIDTVAGLWVQPDSTTTYILEQTICGYTTYDTVTVNILPTNIEAPKSPKGTFSIYPNPNGGSFTITHLLPNENNFYLEIIDITGKVVHREKITTTKQLINTPQLSKGLYFVNFISEVGELMYSTKMSVVK